MSGQRVPRQTRSLTSQSCIPASQPITHNLLMTIIMMIFAFSLGASVVFAQTGATGAIVGTVVDPQGAVVPSADVSITDKSTNTTSKTTTNSAGHYTFSNVSPGSYDIRISKQGFQTAFVRDQRVEIGRTLTEDINLPVGS